METFLFLWIFFIHWTSFNNNQPVKYRWLLQGEASCKKEMLFAIQHTQPDLDVLGVGLPPFLPIPEVEIIFVTK